MSAVTFEWDGLDDLKEAFRNLPAALTGEAMHIIEGEANYAWSQIRQAYPSGGTGNLVSKVGIEPLAAGEFVAGYRVASRAPHAHWYEYGTAIRRTAAGANRGAMFKTPGEGRPTVVPAIEAARLRMWVALGELLVREGLTVTDA